MGFLDIGPLEVLLILVIALLIWGPERIVEIGQTLGKIVRTLKKASFDLTTAVTKELNTEEKDRPSQSKAASGDKAEESSDTGKVEP